MSFKARLRSRALLVTPLIFLAPIAAVTLTSGAASAAGCNTAATYSWTNNCTVSEGAISHYVVAIQMIVDSQEICASLNIDGDFGPATLNGVKCFQREYNITADGIVGPQTWTTMRNSLYFYNTAGGWNYYYSNGVGLVDFRRNNTNGDWYYGGPNATSKWTRMNTSAP